jgi:hypothetical protein
MFERRVKRNGLLGDHEGGTKGFGYGQGSPGSELSRDIFNDEDSYRTCGEQRGKGDAKIQPAREKKDRRVTSIRWV